MSVSDDTKGETYVTTLLHRGPDTLKGLIAGGIVGCTELLISFPLDVGKTQLQLLREKKSEKHLGVTNVLSSMIKKNGFLSVYKGLGIVMCFKAPQESIRFGVYEQLKSIFKNEQGHLPSNKIFLCGLGAGVSEAVVAVTPMETIKVKLIDDQHSDNPKYKGVLLKPILQIIKDEGIRGIYQGLFPTVLKQGTNHGVRFLAVETMKNEYCDRYEKNKVPVTIIGVFGMLAGWISVILNNPVDVVKTRMQGLQSKEYSTTFNCFKRIFYEEGYFAFYKGIKARCLRVGIDAGYTFMCYDIVMDMLTIFIKNR